MRIFDSILFFLMGGIVGAFLYAQWLKTPSTNPMAAEKQHILLERIKLVSKLITVQGDYVVSNSFDDTYMGSRTTALMTTHGKVSVGYDLKKAIFEADSANKIIRVRNLPKVEILAIEHNTDYEHLSQGWWNGIEAEELAYIDDVIKNKLRDSLNTAPIMAEAEKQGLETLDLIKVLVEQGGWTFQVEKNPEPLPNTNPNIPNRELKNISPNPIKN